MTESPKKTARQIIGDAIGRQYADAVLDALTKAGLALMPKAPTVRRRQNMNDAKSTIAGLKYQGCPGDLGAIVADCLTRGVCGCIYGDAVQHIERLRAALKSARVHVYSQSAAEHMMDGFGPRKQQPTDTLLANIDELLASEQEKT